MGYYGNFIENYATLISPLYKLLRKNSIFEWTNEHTTSIEKLKEALCLAPILCYPCYDKQFIIRTDASYQGIGGVLLQLYNDEVKHPVFYISRSLHKSELNYPITELESTASYFWINKFKQYILGNPFQTILYTDHQPLVPIIMKCEPNTSKHAHWCDLFSQLQVKVVYQPGKRNIIADAWSRIRKKENIVVNAIAEENNNNLENNIENNNIVDENNVEIIWNNNNENYQSNFLDEVENEKYISKFMKKFLNDRFITIDDKT